ncbi:GL27059 [Drosophila persimilis]|uniref:protein-tyrosine-phosphatase n=1 Tax=Drosophila persimilis TaxID=7234 RepID=B4HAP2_DROPE|nr:GL27059 [Drosophila persimilis]
MAQKQQARSSGKPQDSGSLTREDFDGGPVSIDEIETGLFLGNLTAATHMETLKSFKITHILTLDSVPLPQHILEASFLTTKYLPIADMPREDILQHLESCVNFISSALDHRGNVLVHCYFGGSRSSSTVIAYMICEGRFYRRVFTAVCVLDPDITRENPEPIVFRCRRCRRVLATKSHVLEHKPRDRLPREGTSTAVPNEDASGETPPPAQTQADNISAPRMLEQVAERIRQSSLGSPGHESTPNHCRSMLFIEPIAWMHRIMLNTQGRLYCPKCEQKLGNFSWINACQCPCGETLSPAFYLIPSKVELSKAVQNVQTTV